MAKIDIRCCDNLELMAQMQDSTVDQIYCDILYGTGRDFGDYKDLKPIRSEIEAHYKPRIKEMHRVLKSTGSIWLQMDSRIDHWIRCILDDVFGYSNFVNSIVWKRSNGMNTAKNLYEITDRLLVFGKTKNYTFNPQYKDLSRSSLSRYNRQDEQGVYMCTNIQSKKNFKFEGDIRVLNGVGFKNKPGLGWDWSQETLNKNIRKGMILEGQSGTIQYKRYLKDSLGSQINTLWDDIGGQTSTKDLYATQKPLSLLERIIKAGSNPGDLVADFYAGSFTTAEACEMLDRNFIGCDINPKACEIGRKRINLQLDEDFL